MLTSTDTVQRFECIDKFRLSTEGKKLFWEQGFLGPYPLLTPDEAKWVCGEILKDIASTQFSKEKSLKFLKIRNRHLDWPIVADLCFHPDLLTKVSDLLGKDITLWRSNLFLGIREKGLLWHQDEYRKLLVIEPEHFSQNTLPLSHLSVHMAISEAPEENCLSILPGSHLIPHEDIEHKYGLEAVDKSVEGTAFYQESQKLSPIKMPLKPGEYFIFHPSLLHKSQNIPNADSRELSRLTHLSRNAFFRMASIRKVGHLPSWLRIGMGLRFANSSVEVLPLAFKGGESCKHAPVSLSSRP